MENKINNPIKKIFEKTVNEITEPEVEEQNFYLDQSEINLCDIVKETEDIIKNMEELVKLKFEKGNLVKRYNTSKLEEILQKNEKEEKNSNIMKLVEDSKYLSNEIIYKITEGNLKNKIPFKNLEVNILLDCSRTISSIEKAHVMYQVCAMANAFYSLEIPYLISVVGDSGFKVVLKKLSDKHSIDYLQKALDCIFIKRNKTNIASCIKTAIELYKENNENNENDESQRVFFIFTNGFDEELVLHEQLQKKIFNNSNNSFVFIFSKAEGIKDEHSKKLTKIWEEFGNYFKDSNVQYVEMYKEKLYTIKDGKVILKDDLKEYCEVIKQSLIRNKNENENKIEESKFEIDKNFDNLTEILSKSETK